MSFQVYRWIPHLLDCYRYGRLDCGIDCKHGHWTTEGTAHRSFAHANWSRGLTHTGPVTEESKVVESNLTPDCVCEAWGKDRERP